MEKSKLITIIIGGVVLLGTSFILVKSCSKPPINPAVEQLQNINDSLYTIIKANNDKTDSLFYKIDSLNINQDTIIQHQEITNEYYRHETYNILNSTPSDATAKFRTTLKKSDSLLKAGFYTRTYNLRSATFQSQLQ